MRTPVMTMKEVLGRLHAEGLIDGDAIAASTEMGAGPADRGTPWYVRAMVAVSAWIAMLLMLGFFYGAQLVRSADSLAVTGSILCAASVVMQRNAKQVLFLTSLALALCFTGQIMLVSGLSMSIHSVVTVSFLVLLLNAGLLTVYDDRTMRFLSTLAIIGAAFSIVLDMHIPYGLQMLTLLLAGGSAAAWLSEPQLASGPLAPFARPVGYGLAAGLFGLLLPWVMPVADMRHFFAPYGSWVIAGGLLLVLLYVEYRLLLEHALLNDRRVAASVLIGTLTLFYPARRMPGMIAAIIVLLIGFRRGNRILMGFALAFLFVFITAYYYHLGLTLLQKSISLMALGAVLIALRFALVRALGLDEEEGNA